MGTSNSLTALQAAGEISWVRGIFEGKLLGAQSNGGVARCLLATFIESKYAVYHY